MNKFVKLFLIVSMVATVGSISAMKNEDGEEDNLSKSNQLLSQAKSSTEDTSAKKHSDNCMAHASYYVKLAEKGLQWPLNKISVAISETNEKKVPFGVKYRIIADIIGGGWKIATVAGLVVLIKKCACNHATPKQIETV
jgi:hypothetical protein